jgi:hypothetical protein
MLNAVAAVPRRPILQAILELLRFERGHATFVVGDDGELTHQETVTTVKMERGETIDAFVARMKQDQVWRAGDTVEFLNNGGRCDTARITRKS